MSGYEEIDSGKVIGTNMGDWTYSTPGVEFESTECARCHKMVGPVLGEDQYESTPCENWIECYIGEVGIVCADCVEILDPADTPQEAAQ